MPKQKQRRLAAIMFTDIVGYSSMMQKNEALAAKLRSRHREVFNRLHEKFHGEIIQYFGDGTLSVFNSTADAVECAVDLQRELKQTPQVPIRIGIHTGDITFSEEEAIGDGVNIAARIQGECVPGGIFISGKAHDDIKNHPELRSRPIGQSSLKNIHQRVDLYAITNPGITVPDYEIEEPSYAEPAPVSPKKIKRKKKKWKAALLAFFLGIFGIHRFYLDQRNLGIAYLTMFFLGAFILPGLEQLVAIPAILGFVDFVIFLTSSRESFDEKYNQDALKQKKQQQRQQAMALAKAKEPKSRLQRQREKYLSAAKASVQNYEHDEAIPALLKAIEIKYDDPEAHFLLARSFSVTEEASKALEHLDIAVAFGLDTDQIRTEGDLAFLRIQPEYIVFENNNFQLPKELPAPQEEILNLESGSSDLLDQLSRLEKERREGLLTEEEFRDRAAEIRGGQISDE
jgi:class 3 adenylate cyclase/TM2 domain-containing membrane protein YozV